MKKFILIIFAAALSMLSLRGQALSEEISTAEVEHAGVEAEVDSTLVGRDIFSTLPEGVTLRQTAQVRNALNSQVAANSSKTYSGFRIRLYFSSSRDAREASAAAISRFNAMYPGIQAYRSYASPNFKVTVGNFRTRVEAEAVMRKLKADFPDAFIVRETFKYPSIGSSDFTYAAGAGEYISGSGL